MPLPRMEELEEDECPRHPAEITDLAHLERLRALPLYPWAPGERSRYVRVRLGSVSGRRIRIPDELPFTWWG